jgi:DNA-binding NarL/FixJ family response regulator
LRIVIVDDHPVVRKGLTHLINDEADLTVCGESDTAAGAALVVAAERPDVAIVDLALGADSGLELVWRSAGSRHSEGGRSDRGSRHRRVPALTRVFTPRVAGADQGEGQVVARRASEDRTNA